MLRIRDCGRPEALRALSATEKKIKNVPVSELPSPYFDYFSVVLNNYITKKATLLRLSGCLSNG